MINKNERDITFLVFSDDWGEHPSSCQHLFKHISKDHGVLWVNTIGMRSPKPTLSDLNKAVKKIRKMTSSHTKNNKSYNPDAKLQVCQPPLLPFSNIDLIRRINCMSVKRTVWKRMNESGLKRPILATTVPNACDYIGRFGEQGVIYYCVDDFSEWPGMDRRLVKKMENELVSKSDLFIATSAKLLRKLELTGKPAFLLTHGVDLEFFTREALQEHELLKNIPKPRIGYFGLFDERSDQKVIADLAGRMRDLSFVITGDVETDISKLEKYSNVHFTGKIKYSELPELVKGFDILFLPYVLNELTEAISPLKLKEYLATGKPVIASPISEVLKFKEFVSITESISDWELAIKSCLNGQVEKGSVSVADLLKSESWQLKSAQFMDYCRLSLNNSAAEPMSK